MPNDYLSEIHGFISEKIADVNREKTAAEASGDVSRVSFCNGQLEELAGVRAFMTAHYDLAGHNYY